MSSEDNKRIARNSVALYIRMFIGMAVSLYTSRVVLQVLGVENFGVYNVVGGVVSLFSFLNASMSGATSRFITYELGCNNRQKLRLVFNNAMLAHLIIAVSVVILCETIGLWLLKYELEIPADSKTAAMWVFQCSILSMALNITQIPYTACIIAHERMKAFAYTDILNTFLKLGIVYLLLIIPGEKLRIYGLLLLSISIIITLIYRLYCIRNFEECHLSINCLDRSYMKSMLKFSGWDLFGNFSWVARIQGVSLIINIFFGAIANAAIGVSNQVQGAITAFSNSITMAIKPQIIKSYAANQELRCLSLISIGIKITFIALLTLSIPLILYIRYILDLWLVVVPKYAPVITQLTIVCVIFSAIPTITITGVHATGNIKKASVVSGLIYLSTVPITYGLYKMHFSIYAPFVINIITVVLCGCTNYFFITKYLRVAKFSKFFFNIVLRCIIAFILCFGFCTAIKGYLPDGNFIKFCLASIITGIITLALGYLITLNKFEKAKINELSFSFCKRSINNKNTTCN